MADYFSKATLLSFLHYGISPNCMMSPVHIERILDCIPAVDAMPVVRCRDCLWRGENKVCTYLIGKTLDDFYCAKGEKRG